MSHRLRDNPDELDVYVTRIAAQTAIPAARTVCVTYPLPSEIRTDPTCRGRGAVTPAGYPLGPMKPGNPI